MDESGLPTSPRKKLKTGQVSPNMNMEDTTAWGPTNLPRATDVNNLPKYQFPRSPRKDPDTSSSPLVKAVEIVPTDILHHNEKPSTDREMAVDVLQDQQEAESTLSDVMQSSIHGKQEAEQLSKEAACGITEFVSPDLLGFTGILKKRYTDFLVNEILLSGQVVHLDNLKAPTKSEQRKGQMSEAITISPSQKQPESLEPGNKQELHTTVNDRSWPPLAGIERGSVPQTPMAPSRADLQEINSSSNPNQSERDPLAENTKNVSPHKRIPQPQTIPLSMRDFDNPQPEPQPEKSTRRKETVLIRQTSQGWVEVDEQKEKEAQEAAEDGASENRQDNNCPENSTIREAHDDRRPTKDGADSAKSKTVSHEPEPEEQKTYYTPAPSTQGSWQAFAGTESAGTPAGFELKPEDKETLLSFFSTSVVKDILALYDRIVDSPHRRPKDYGMVKSAVIDRQTRSRIHEVIRRTFNSRLETATDSDGAMLITAMPERPVFNARKPMNNNDRSKNQVRRGKPGWKELGGEYLHFSLYKENKDTMEVISWLAKVLKTKPQTFQFAGTKDRRGVTVQRVSVYRMFIDRLIIAGRSLKNARIGNFEYQPHPLQLGELTGNEFVITLRDCDFHYPVRADTKTIVNAAESIVGTAIKNLGDYGFLNYYGLQRFGTFSTSTDDVGLKMLREDFQGAVEAILTFSPTSLAAAQDPMSGGDKISKDDKARAHALHSFKTSGKAYPALDNLPRKFSAEASIIRHLGRPGQGSDFVGALQTISRNLRLMYVHAYQSLVWNMAASERWKRFGNTIMEGDLVLINEHVNNSETAIKQEDVDEDGEAIIRPSWADRATNPEDLFIRARALTKGEVESGNYTIFDIVLPTPGYDILYPANEMEKFYEEFMASERGGGLDPHDMRRKWKDVSLSGSYRKMLAKPGEDISFEIKTYDKDDEQFVETDMDLLNEDKQRRAHERQKRPEAFKEKDAEAEGGNDEAQDEDDEDMDSDSDYGGVALDGTYHPDFKIAVVLKLQLGASQYATMALRELMKSGGVKTYKPDFGGGR